LPSVKKALTISRLELYLFAKKRHGGNSASLIVFRILEKDWRSQYLPQCKKSDAKWSANQTLIFSQPFSGAFYAIAKDYVHINEYFNHGISGLDKLSSKQLGEWNNESHLTLGTVNRILHFHEYQKKRPANTC